ncbi:aminotransferase class I/II-fold pyridoxal phosphate-dependent enzyme [Streptomyces sp. JJ66]|uniref:aminotransferase class I/II-fold pyridoxal phosphate-dependent enzyme n=1 Tax=Streptomyces sp. JJ66 TaxID=2803843 RepID=UPI001C56F699|nr:aminotransferase class I/II-fold pyridoxal phosphate-dependent enzyme [Streptomyces sp. JJ66]MBW1603741.1 aminotransferase class I/II-fold pyridoxal phosphate-dependent enzyme [Streptomyces sp. JJ66]
MSVRKKAAVIGLGHQALQDHLPGLADSQFAHLVAVCDTDADKVAALARQHDVPGFTDTRTLLDEVRPDFAIVAVPHHAGREVIAACAAGGVHVMKEKPFATGPAEAAALVALCDKAGIELMVTVQRRFHPVYTAAVQLLEQVGQPYLIEGRYTFHCSDPAAGWRGDASLAGGGALMDMGYHLIDLLIWYVGLSDRVLAGTSTAAQPDADYDAEDTALVHLVYDRGLYGSLLISRSAGPKTEQLTITGPRGAVVIERGRVRRLAPDGQLIESLTREPAWPSAATAQIDCLPRTRRPAAQPLRPRHPRGARRVPRRRVHLQGFPHADRPEGVPAVTTSPLALFGGPPVIDTPGPHFCWPPIEANDVAAVTGQLNSAVSIPDRSGVVAELEDALASFLGVRHVVTTCTGTAALHSMYAAVGVGPGDEVIVPTLTFHATATPLFHLGARPVLAEVDEHGQLALDDAARRITARTKAIVAVHLWGLPESMEALTNFSARHGLMLLEDGSHAHGATWRGQPVGSFGRAAAFSMNGPKPLSAGEGGFVATDDTELYYRVLLHGQYNKRCRREIPTDHALAPYAVTGMGLKLRIHPLAAALAHAQLPRLKGYLAGREAVATRMRRALRGVPGIDVPHPASHAGPAWYALPLRYDPPRLAGLPVERFIEAVHAEGASEIELPGSTRPLSDHQLFRAPGALLPGYADHRAPPPKTSPPPDACTTAR